MSSELPRASASSKTAIVVASVAVLCGLLAWSILHDVGGGDCDGGPLNCPPPEPSVTAIPGGTSGNGDVDYQGAVPMPLPGATPNSNPSKSPVVQRPVGEPGKSTGSEGTGAQTPAVLVPPEGGTDD